MNKKIFICIILQFLLLTSFLISNQSKKLIKIKKCLINHNIITPKNLLKNPLLIEFPEKKDISNEEYQQIQNKLQKIDISNILNELYLNCATDHFILKKTLLS